MHGFVVARSLLSPAKDLQPVMDEYAQVLDRVAQRLHHNGGISSTFANLPFLQRGVIEAQPFDISLLTPETEFHFGLAVLALLTSDRLLDGVESLIGPEITSNPAQHVRIKPPEHLLRKNPPLSLSRTGWHQDNGVVDPVANDTNMLTVWLPLTEATERNGCLTVVPGSYHEGLVAHCPTMQNGVKVSNLPPAIIEKQQVQPLPMVPGDVLFMHRRCMHASLSNHSDNVRWSFDIRYNPTGQSTGRESLPSFIARSRENPASELRDPNTWYQM